MKYKNIVFDVDGTLIDTEYAVLHSLQDTLTEACSYNIELSELVFVLGITGEDALKKLNVADVPSVINEWNNKMIEYKNSIALFDGMAYTLKKLLNNGYKLGIVTSKTREELEQDFSSFNITDLFETVVCADDTTAHKPSPEPLLKYLEISHADKNDVLYIGDSNYDSMCAEKANIDFALAKWGAKENNIKAIYYLDEPLDLLFLENEKELTEPWLT